MEISDSVVERVGGGHVGLADTWDRDLGHVHLEWIQDAINPTLRISGTHPLEGCSCLIDLVEASISRVKRLAERDRQILDRLAQ
jgi:hypothetical protein